MKSSPQRAVPPRLVHDFLRGVPPEVLWNLQRQTVGWSASRTDFSGRTHGSRL